MALTLFAGVGWGRGSRAAQPPLRASKPEVRDEVVATIEDQLAAFRANDVAKAYGFAAVDVRMQMPQRTFASVVRNNYPEIWASTRAEFGLVRDDGLHATVLVHVFGKESNTAYDYVLMKERSVWRIASVLRHEPRKKDNV
jgi:hypothetical protein